MIAGFLRALADFIDAVQQARVQQLAGFADREYGDYLDHTDAGDAYWHVIAIDEWRTERPDHDASTGRHD